MATPHTITQVWVDKPAFRTSSTDVSKNSKKYSMDGVDDGEAGNDLYAQPDAPREGFTKNDQKDMYRMGKIQELKRNYRPLSALSFAVVLTAVWEYFLMANTQGLIDGGLAGVFWAYVWTFIGFSFVELSLAEMASMAPISGGQYHWVSEFAPPSIQKFLSYITGWMSVMSWQAGNASGSFLTGTIVQALLTVNYPAYEPQPYQGTLLVFACVLILYLVNTYGSGIWPMIQNGLLVLHFLGFLIVVIVLWVMAPHQSAKAVFTEFTNSGGWNSIGLSMMVGQISAIYSLLGSDATAHMAEEVRDAGRYVPISIFYSYLFNGFVTIIFIISYLFAIPSVADALDDPSGYPFIYVFRNAVSTAGVNGLTSLVLIIVIAANVSFNASTARQTFAFARDRGLPFSDWLSKVHPKKKIPSNAILFTCVMTCLLSLINIGSTTAFNAIISLQVCSIMATYSLSIACVLYRRLRHPELLPNARWSLGKWGVVVNILGLAYVMFVFFWSFWPVETPVALDNFNWSVVMFIGVVAISLVMYVVRGHRDYHGPVTQVRAVRLE